MAMASKQVVSVIPFTRRFGKSLVRKEQSDTPLGMYEQPRASYLE